MSNTYILQIILVTGIALTPQLVAANDLPTCLRYQFSGELDSALACYNGLLRKDPLDPYAITYRGEVYRLQGKFDEAKKEHERALKINDQNAPAHTHLGIILWIFGEDENALAEHNKAIQLDGKFAQAYNNRGVVYESLGKDSEAMTDYNKAIELKANLDIAWANRGLLYFRQKDATNAMKDLSEAIKLGNKWPTVYAYRGRLLAIKGEVRPAMQDLQQALKLNNKLAMAHYDLGLIYLRQGDPAKAVESLTQAVQYRYKPAGNAELAKGIALLSASKPQEALNELTEAEKVLPNNPSVTYHKGIAQEALGKTQEAIESYQKTLELDKEFWQAKLNWAALLLPTDLIKAEQLISELPAGTARVTYINGVLAYEKAVKADPTGQATLLAEAKGHFESALKLFLGNSEKAEVYSGLSKVNALMGQKEDAIRAAEMAVQLDSTNAAYKENLAALKQS